METFAGSEVTASLQPLYHIPSSEEQPRAPKRKSQDKNQVEEIISTYIVLEDGSTIMVLEDEKQLEVLSNHSGLHQAEGQHGALEVQGEI